MARERGAISLLETVSVLAIVGVLATTASPALSQILRIYRLNAAAREVFAQLQGARIAAISQNARYSWNLVAGSDRMYRVDGATAGAVRDIQANCPGVSLSGAATVSFNPSGTAPNSGTIVLTNTYGTTRQVSVSPAGLIQIQ